MTASELHELIAIAAAAAIAAGSLTGLILLSLATAHTRCAHRAPGTAPRHTSRPRHAAGGRHRWTPAHTWTPAHRA